MQKVSVQQLEVGMYVAQLDRPWLETPFLFQGFYIRSEGEIEELRAHCQHVYINQDNPVEPVTVNGSRGPAAGRKASARKPAPRSKIFSWLTGSGPADDVPPEQFEETGTFYPAVTGLKEEMTRASGVHSEAVSTVQSVMNELQNSGGLNVPRLQGCITPMVDSVLRNPAALSCLVRLQKKGSYHYRHSLASSVWAMIIGRHIGLSRDDLNVIALGAMLLDVGKIRIQDELLQKPGKLDDHERKLIRQHVEFGLEILREGGEVDSRVIEMVAHHHERYDGSGYPQGLKGSDIPVFGRIAGIVDTYDAMITARPYAKTLSSYDALRQLRLSADTAFQAEMVEQFTRAIGVFPTGTLVELNTQEIAVVTKQNRIRRLRPEVMIIMNAQRDFLEKFQVVDLNDEKLALDGSQPIWIERGLAPGSFGIDPTEFYLS